MKTLLVDIHPHFKFINILKSLKLIDKNSIKIQYISFESSLLNIEFQNLGNKIHYTYDKILDINSTDAIIPEGLDENKIYKFLDIMLSDPRLISIFERSYFTKFYNTKRIRIINILFFQAINFLKRVKPKAYILYATPHNINTYILKWACFSLGIDVVYLQESILPWRFYTIFEKENNRYLLNKGKKWNVYDKLFLDLYKKRLNKNDYIAPYVLQKNQRLFTLAGEIKKYWNRPDLIINKLYIYRYYKKITKNFKIPKSDYVFFPLNFSPERSTLPDGGKYFNQFRAIHEIRSKIGKKIKIVVKEHPSTFKYVCHWGERNKHFYKAIYDLGNVIFAPVNFSLVKLIKNSSTCISINSSVILDSLLLEKKCFYMSDHRIFGAESSNLHKFQNFNKNKIISLLNKPKILNNFNYNWFENYTILPQTINKEWDNSISSFRAERSKNYNIMLLKLVKLYSKKNIKNYLKPINKI